MAKKSRPAKVAPLDLPPRGGGGKVKDDDGFGLDSSDSDREEEVKAKVNRGKNNYDDIDFLEEGESKKKDEPPKDVLGNVIVLDEFGKPINPVVTGKEASRFEQEIDYVMGNIETRLFSLKLDEIFQKNKVIFIMLTMGTTLIGFVLFLYGTNMSVIFQGTKQSIDYVAIAFAGVFWMPVFCFLSYMIFPYRKEERKRRRRLAWDRKDRRKSNLFNQLVDEARGATEPPPYKTRVVAHFRKKEYPIVAARWKDFCEIFQHHTTLPPERQLIRYEGVDFDIDLTKSLHDPPYNVKQNGHLWIYNRGGYFTQDTFVKRQYEELISYKPPPSPYEKPPNFDIEPPLNLKTLLGDVSSKYSFRGSSRDGGNKGGGRDSISGGGNRDSLNGGGNRSSLRSGGANGGEGGSGRSSKEFANGRPITPVKAGAAAAKAKLGIGTKKPGSAGPPGSASGAKPSSAATAAKPLALPAPQITTVAHMPQIAGGSVTGGGSVVSGGGSTVGGSVATGVGAMRGDRSLASTIS